MKRAIVAIDEEIGMKISEIITDKYKLRMPPTVYYELLADVLEAEEEQETKTGQWIKQALGYKCSNCTLCTNEKGRLTYNYCPNCGCRMVEPQESESKRCMELAKSYSQGLRAGLAESEGEE